MTTTWDHPFWNDTDGEWQRAADLDSGDVVLTADGGSLVVGGVDWSTTGWGGAYNLTVDETHTYFVGVGDAEALVHNTGLDDCGKGLAPTSALGDPFRAPGTFVNRHDQLANGIYTLDKLGMVPHQTGNLGSGRSKFFSWVDADTAVLDAAAYADDAGLWVGNRAKVYVENGPVGALSTTGEPTNWINVYRTNTGFVHGTPGSSP